MIEWLQEWVQNNIFNFKHVNFLFTLHFLLSIFFVDDKLEILSLIYI